MTEESHKQNNDSGRLQPFLPPPVKRVRDFVRPFMFYFSPRFFGMENVDASTPCMFVTNHTVYGLTDGFLFGAELYIQKGIFVRALVDDLHFQIPVWKDKVREAGFVRASRENCAALMEARENILVFPGGARETWKRKGEAYKLLWKDHIGFARMAVQYEYDIIPVAQVGGDDALKIVADADDLMKSFIGKILAQSGIVKKYLRGGDIIPPVTRGLFGLLGVPKPVNLYIAFGKPIGTKRFMQKNDDEETLWLLRNEVELAMEKLFIRLLEYRDRDKQTGFFRRWLTG